MEKIWWNVKKSQIIWQRLSVKSLSFENSSQTQLESLSISNLDLIEKVGKVVIKQDKF